MNCDWWKYFLLIIGLTVVYGTLITWPMFLENSKISYKNWYPALVLINALVWILLIIAYGCYAACNDIVIKL